MLGKGFIHLFGRSLRAQDTFCATVPRARFVLACDLFFTQRYQYQFSFCSLNSEALYEINNSVRLIFSKKIRPNWVKLDDLWFHIQIDFLWLISEKLVFKNM